MGYDTDVCSLSRGQNFCRVEEESRRLIKHPASWRLGWGAETPAPGSQKRGDGDTALRTSGGAQWVLLKSTGGLDTQVASCSSSMSVSWVSLRGRLLIA
jgi:hypothetical protein